MRNVFLILLVLGVIWGVVYLVNRPVVEKSQTTTSMTEETKKSKDDGVTEKIEIDTERVSGDQEEGYIAGNQSLLLETSEEKYNESEMSDKLVVLYFYANWCPICREEFEDTVLAFNQLDDSNVIGFRVNYSDSETSAFEKSLASQFGVAYQHTKVFVRNGEQLLKAPDSWDVQRYLDEIGNYQ